MKRVYDRAEDKNVAAVKIYENSGSYYFDADHEEEVPAEKMFNLFCKGVICKSDGSWYQPKSCTEAGVIDFGI